MKMEKFNACNVTILIDALNVKVTNVWNALIPKEI